MKWLVMFSLIALAATGCDLGGFQQMSATTSAPRPIPPSVLQASVDPNLAFEPPPGWQPPGATAFVVTTGNVAPQPAVRAELNIDNKRTGARVMPGPTNAAIASGSIVGTAMGGLVLGGPRMFAQPGSDDAERAGLGYSRLERWIIDSEPRGAIVHGLPGLEGSAIKTVFRIERVPFSSVQGMSVVLEGYAPCTFGQMTRQVVEVNKLTWIRAFCRLEKIK